MLKTIKDKLFNTLGIAGVILYYIITLIITVLPFVMIGANFFVTLLLLAINTFLPFTSAIFWIWGLVCAINGVQDIWAIIYYILFVIMWIPYYISIIVSIIASFFKKD